MQLRLLYLFTRMMLLDASFPADGKIPVANGDMYLSDAATVLGLSYGPAAAPADADTVKTNAGDTAAVRKPPTHLRLIAGKYFCRSLTKEVVIQEHPAILASAQLLAAMRSLGCTMRGRPFKMLCAESLLFRSLSTKLTTFGALIGNPPPCTYNTMRSADMIPPLSVVALPKVTAKPQRLDNGAKARIMQSPTRWIGPAVINTADLSWILFQWLPVGSLGVPADARPVSQDIFLRLSGGVVGFALKVASASAGTDWGDLRNELSKEPKLTVPYSLVVWSLHLAPGLLCMFRTADHVVHPCGKWLANETLQCVNQVKEGDFTFEVHPDQELVIANPRAPPDSTTCLSTQGLAAVFDGTTFRELQSMSTRPGKLSTSRLSAWIAHNSIASDTTVQ
jgi:hypothetical protein